MEKVLVTGATGYIGLHCIQQLLSQGYAVNGSIRSPERKNEVLDALKKSGTSSENLNLYVFDLTSDEMSELDEVLKRQKKELKRLDEKISAFNVGVNVGKDAGQSIMHCHIHLIPRRKGDVEDPRGGVRGVIPEKQKYKRK